jgi:hypothetical protein
MRSTGMMRGERELRWLLGSVVLRHTERLKRYLRPLGEVEVRTGRRGRRREERRGEEGKRRGELM